MNPAITQIGLSPVPHLRLPLGAPVQYEGMTGKISGRTFGRLEKYDIEVELGGARFHFPGLERDQFTVSVGAAP